MTNNFHWFFIFCYFICGIYFFFNTPMNHFLKGKI